MKYYEVKIYTNSEGIEPVSGVLEMIGQETFVIEDVSVVDEFLEKKNVYDWDYVDASVLEKKESSLTLYVEPEEAGETIAMIRRAVADLKQRSGELYGRLSVEETLVDDASWKDNWKEYFKLAKITENIVIRPEWEEYTPEAGEKIITINPGMAFGTGTHPTTGMCIQLLEKYIRSPQEVVLDLGCGSGILSVAAVLCGVGSVEAVDLDPNAVTASMENIEKNGMSDRITVREGDVTKGLGLQADLIVANLVAELIVMLAPDIRQHLKGRKIFIASGILNEKEQMVTTALEEEGFEILEIRESDDWSAIACRLA